ncbi:MAG TPA: HEAT repeat domain-containing protein [Planctomycetota bacterium]|nr:HEAT repeat domain-containing protein [Planctomycetota bacterium]
MHASSLLGPFALAAVALGQAQDPAPAQEPRSAAQWVAELESGSFAEAKRGLLALGACDALPALVQAIAELPPSASWQAVRVLRGFPAQDAADRSAFREAVKVLGKQAVGAPEAERRRLAAFALGALGEQASSTAKDLARRLEDEEVEAVRLACTLALADLGEDALKPLLKLLESERVTPKGLALAALALQGTDKGGVAKSIEKLAVRPESFHAFLVGGVSLFALERCAKPPAAANAASEQRKLMKVQIWLAGRNLNWAGAIQQEPTDALEFFAFLTGLPKPRPREYSAPAAFDRAMGEWFTIGDGYRQLLEHLARELEPIREGLRADAYPSFVAFEGETRPLVRLAELLHAVDPFVPSDSKR